MFIGKDIERAGKILKVLQNGINICNVPGFVLFFLGKLLRIASFSSLRLCIAISCIKATCLMRCRGVFYTPNAFGFPDQRILRWTEPGQSPIAGLYLIFFIQNKE